MFRFKQFFLKRYEQEKPEYRQKVSSLLFIDLVLACGGLIISIFLQPGFAKIAMFTLCCIYALSLFLIRAGYFKFVSTLTLVSVWLAICGIVFVHEWEHGMQVFMLAFFTLFVAVVASLVAYARWQLLGIAVLNLCAQCMLLPLRIFPSFKNGIVQDTLEDLFATIVVNIIASLILFILFTKNKKHYA
jgi:hypothetical protein